MLGKGYWYRTTGDLGLEIKPLQHLHLQNEEGHLYRAAQISQAKEAAKLWGKNRGFLSPKVRISGMGALGLLLPGWLIFSKVTSLSSYFLICPWG